MENPDARTLLNILSNCYTELRIFAYEFSARLGAEEWTHSVYLEGPSADGQSEGSISPSVLFRVAEHATVQLALTLSWQDSRWTVEGDIGRSDERDEDSYELLWQAEPVSYSSLDAALRALGTVTGELLAAARHNLVRA